MSYPLSGNKFDKQKSVFVLILKVDILSLDYCTAYLLFKHIDSFLVYLFYISNIVSFPVRTTPTR